MTSTLEFEGIDYTAKALVTESVYDSYRLIENPVTNQLEFLNENEAEYAYMAKGYSRQKGYDVWNTSTVSFRDVHKFNKKLGIAELIPIIEYEGKSINILDIVRPRSNTSIADDGRSRILETKIKTAIRQLSSTINGMLDQQDKSELARNYAGALIVSFRGWMVTQSGEFYKDGKDFYDYEQDVDTGTGIKKWLERMNVLNQDVLRSGSIDDNNYDGQYNFATGTIDKGMHRNLYKTISKHVSSLIQMILVLPEFIGNSKQRHTQHMSINEFH